MRPTVRDPALRFGQPAMLAGGVRPQNSLRAFGAPFRQLRPVSARSMGMLRCPRAPRPLCFSARTEGMGETIRAIASLGPGEPSPLPSPRGRGRNSGGLLMGTSPAIVRVELVEYLRGAWLPQRVPRSA